LPNYVLKTGVLLKELWLGWRKRASGSDEKKKTVRRVDSWTGKRESGAERSSTSALETKGSEDYLGLWKA